MLCANLHNTLLIIRLEWISHDWKRSFGRLPFPAEEVGKDPACNIFIEERKQVVFVGKVDNFLSFQVDCSQTGKRVDGYAREGKWTDEGGSDGCGGERA